VKGPRILSVGELLWGKGGALVYVTGLLEGNQITIPDVELEVQAMARVREQIHGGAEGKILANSTALGNQSLLMFLTTKESKAPFRAGSMH
jgi:hypothetical protein